MSDEPRRWSDDEGVPATLRAALQQARDESPPPGALAAVEASLAARLGPAFDAGGAPPGSAPPGSEAPPGSAGPGEAAGGLPGSGAQGAGAAAVSSTGLTLGPWGAGGALVVLLGLGLGLTLAPGAASPTRSALPVASAAGAVSLGTPPHGGAPGSGEAPGSGPAARAPNPEERGRASLPSAAPLTPSALPSTSAASTAPRTGGAGTALSEIQLLAAAEAALRTDAARALALCEEHARRFPSSALAQERSVVRMEALRRLGRTGDARAESLEFDRRFPGSAHGARVRAVRE